MLTLWAKTDCCGYTQATFDEVRTPSTGMFLHANVGRVVVSQRPPALAPQCRINAPPSDSALCTFL